jgi:hypothetical protein
MAKLSEDCEGGTIQDLIPFTVPLKFFVLETRINWTQSMIERYQSREATIQYMHNDQDGPCIDEGHVNGDSV